MNKFSLILFLIFIHFSSAFALETEEVSDNFSIYKIDKTVIPYYMDFHQYIILSPFVYSPSLEDHSEVDSKEKKLSWDDNEFGPQTGIASLYASKFNGRKTASGERHDKNSHTAAHKKLPFGTEVTVTNIEQGEHFGKSVLVTINDRGPFIKGRIIDLSREAAKKIGLTLRKGITEVKIQIANIDESNNNLNNKNDEPISDNSELLQKENQ